MTTSRLSFANNESRVPCPVSRVPCPVSFAPFLSIFGLKNNHTMKTSDRKLLKGYYWNHDAIRQGYG